MLFRVIKKQSASIAPHLDWKANKLTCWINFGLSESIAFKPNRPIYTRPFRQEYEEDFNSTTCKYIYVMTIGGSLITTWMIIMCFNFLLLYGIFSVIR